MSVTVVRPLRTALIAALKAANTSAGSRVFTPPVPQGQGFPRLVIDGWAEDPSNFYGRHGSWARGQIKGQAQSNSGDKPREVLWEETHAALQSVAVPGHLLLVGTLRRVASYLDPDGVTLHFVGAYEATTRES